MLLQQVAALNPRFRDLRNARSMAFVTRNARAIADLQERGLADRGVDASMAAMALSGMVARLAYEAFTGGAVVESVDDLVEPVEVVDSGRLLALHPPGLAACALDAGLCEPGEGVLGVEGVAVEGFEADGER